MENQHPIITIDVWSDLVCPWCWIAKKRFEKGLSQFVYRDHVIINHHSFRIADNLPAVPFKEALYKKFGGAQQAEVMMKQVKAAGEDEGLNYRFDTMLFGNTIDALVLLSGARREGVGDEVAERLFCGSIEEGRSIFDKEELVTLAVEAGMQEATALAALSDTALRSGVTADEQVARSLGASGVPLYVFNRKYAISGAQPVENFLSALNQVWSENLAEHETLGGPSCSDGACSI